MAAEVGVFKGFEIQSPMSNISCLRIEKTEGIGKKKRTRIELVPCETRYTAMALAQMFGSVEAAEGQEIAFLVASYGALTAIGQPEDAAMMEDPEE